MVRASQFQSAVRTSRSATGWLGRWLFACFVLLLSAAAVPWALGDPRVARLAANTLWLAGATVACSVPLGTLLAVVLSRTDLPGRRALGFALVGLLFVPLYLQTGAWQAGFGLEGWFTVGRAGAMWLDGWRAAVWIHTVAALPWVVLFVSAGLRLVERELEEAALLDGSGLQVLMRVTLARAWPAAGLAALWVAVTTAGEMTVTDFFQVRTYAEEVFTQNAATGEPGQVPLTVLPGVALTAWVAVAALLFVAQIAPFDWTVSHGAGHVFRLGRLRWADAGLFLMIVATAVGIPLASLVWKTGVLVAQTSDGRVRSWSVGKCALQMLKCASLYRREFFWSSVTGALAATTATIAAGWLAWTARRGFVFSLPALLCMVAALAVPGPVVGLSLIPWFNHPGLPLLNQLYDNSIVPMWLVQTWRAFPLALLILWPSLGNFPRESLESAALEGAGGFTLLAKIVLPQRRAAVSAAWLASFAACLAELDATWLVKPPGVETLATRIFELLHGGVEDVVAGISLTMFVGFELLSLIIAWLVWPKTGSSSRPPGG